MRTEKTRYCAICKSPLDMTTCQKANSHRFRVDAVTCGKPKKCSDYYANVTRYLWQKGYRKPKS
jgi:hypothetical protein